jgi:hypothetical protein
MATWLAVVVVIVVVLAAGLLRDSLRTQAVNRWCRTHGFVFVPKAEHDRERLIAWAERFRPFNATHWGIVLRRESGAETFVAEHREKPSNGPERWHTLAVMRVPGLQSQGVRISRAPSQTLRSATDAILEPAKQVRDHLGIEVTERPTLHPVGCGQWAVDAATADALRFWSSASQASAIDAWPHDAELAAIDDYVLVRLPGLISTSSLDQVLTVVEAARAFFTQDTRRTVPTSSA